MVRAEVFLISQASSQSDICLVVAAPAAPLTLQALREEFAPDLGHDDVEHITLDPTVAMLTVVGLNMRGKSRIVERTFAALGRGNVDVIAIAQGSSECNLSVVVPKDDMQMALVTTHQEFNLGID
jgi:aspartokinase